jgi:hypothetical protein
MGRKSPNRRMLEYKIENFEMSIFKLGYSICKEERGQRCNATPDCGKDRRIGGIRLCFER